MNEQCRSRKLIVEIIAGTQDFSYNLPQVCQSHRHMVQIHVPGRRPEMQTAMPTECTLNNSECKHWHPKEQTQKKEKAVNHSRPEQGTQPHPISIRKATFCWAQRGSCQACRKKSTRCCYCYSRYTQTASGIFPGAIYTSLPVYEISAVMESKDDAGL